MGSQIALSYTTQPHTEGGGDSLALARELAGMECKPVRPWTRRASSHPKQGCLSQAAFEPGQGDPGTYQLLAWH